MGAVAVVVHGIAAVADGVYAVDVVDVAVLVVVHGVAGRFPGVAPDVGGQVGMSIIDARVDDRDHHLRRTGCRVPCSRGLDGFHAPQVRVQGVIGLRLKPLQVIGLGVKHLGLLAVKCDRVCHAQPLLEFHMVQVEGGEIP